MAWTCSCGANNEDDLQTCIECGLRIGAEPARIGKYGKSGVQAIAGVEAPPVRASAPDMAAEPFTPPVPPQRFPEPEPTPEPWSASEPESMQTGWAAPQTSYVPEAPVDDEPANPFGSWATPEPQPEPVVQPNSINQSAPISELASQPTAPQYGAPVPDAVPPYPPLPTNYGVRNKKKLIAIGAGVGVVGIIAIIVAISVILSVVKNGGGAPKALTYKINENGIAASFPEKPAYSTETIQGIQLGYYEAHYNKAYAYSVGKMALPVAIPQDTLRNEQFTSSISEQLSSGLIKRADGSNATITNSKTNEVTDVIFAQSYSGVSISFTFDADNKPYSGSIVFGLDTKGSTMFFGGVVAKGTNLPLYGDFIKSISFPGAAK